MKKCKFIKDSPLVQACETKFYLSCKLVFMSYEMTHWTSNTQEWPTLTHDIVS